MLDCAPASTAAGGSISARANELLTTLKNQSDKSLASKTPTVKVMEIAETSEKVEIVGEEDEDEIDDVEEIIEEEEESDSGAADILAAAASAEAAAAADESAKVASKATDKPVVFPKPTEDKKEASSGATNKIPTSELVKKIPSSISGKRLFYSSLAVYLNLDYKSLVMIWIVFTSKKSV